MAAVRVRLFASAREAAGAAQVECAGVETIADVLSELASRFGETFGAVVAASRIWLNGDEPDKGEMTALRDGDEIAVLPPVSGG